MRANPIIASAILLGTIIITLSTFTNAVTNLRELVVTETRPGMNGEWKAEVTYDWKNAKYSETFTFNGEGEEVYGTASFLGVQRGILEGKAKENHLQFITRTHEMLGDSNPTENIVHRYEGKISVNEIKFVMQTEGGVSEHRPIEFVARKEVKQ